LVAIVIHECFTIGLLAIAKNDSSLFAVVKIAAFIVNIAMLVDLLRHGLEERSERLAWI
jgi:hypothetical protein